MQSYQILQLGHSKIPASVNGREEGKDHLSSRVVVCMLCVCVVYVHACVSTYVFTCMHVCAHMHAFACVSMCVFTCIHTYVCVCGMHV